jgi:hypothetical protein
MLFICEIKFSKDPIPASVIDEVEQKLQALKVPKGYSCNPVLIHLGGVTDSLIDKDYFVHMIDFSKILNA